MKKCPIIRSVYKGLTVHTVTHRIGIKKQAWNLIPLQRKPIFYQVALVEYWHKTLAAHSCILLSENLCFHFIVKIGLEIIYERTAYYILPPLYITRGGFCSIWSLWKKHTMPGVFTGKLSRIFCCFGQNTPNSWQLLKHLCSSIKLLLEMQEEYDIKACFSRKTKP